MLTDTRHSKNAKVYPLDARCVTWTGGLWEERTRTCRNATVPQLQHMFEEKDISHVVENFRICAGEAEGDFDGTVFGDGDFYKWMESAVYTAVKTGNQELMAKIDGYIELIGKAQQSDGYLSTKQIIGEMRKNGVSRMGDINDFEVYNFGHMFTSACLHYRMTGKDSFLKIAVKTCDYLEKLYETAERTGEVQTAVCPSHYMGLAEMYRTTRDPRYLNLLKKAVALRDSVKNGMDDNQDRIPLLSHDRIHGHAVRANYLYAGLADLCLEMEQDPENRELYEKYLDVLHKVWNSLIHKKLYVTGGCGALYNGVSPYGNFFKDQKIHQAYGYEYQLPNVTAYNETCASLGGVFWAYRMFQLEPKAVYFDVLERMMLNTNLAAFSLDGKKFFYENTLRREKKLDYELVWPLTRSEYILSYCCPPNLARTVAESEEYAYMLDKDSVWTGLYGDSRAQIRLENGASFTLVQKTEYPYNGRIVFSGQQAETCENGSSEEDHSDNSDACGSVPFTLKLRIPGWVQSGRLECRNTGSTVAPCAGEKCADENPSETPAIRLLTSKDAGTYLAVPVQDPTDFQVILTLDMPVRYTKAHSMVEEADGLLCVERGPLVYCAEGMDTTAESLSDLYLDLKAEFTEEPVEIEGRKMTALRSEQYEADWKNHDRDALYQPLQTLPVKNACAASDLIQAPKMKKTSVRMIPYFAWDNRGYEQMRIWFPVVLGQPEQAPAPQETTDQKPQETASQDDLPFSILSQLPGADPAQAEQALAEAAENFDRKIVVLDDDPTGVQTVHDVSVYTDWDEDSIRQGFQEKNSMFFILTNSRSFSAEKTAKVHQEIAGRVEKISRETKKAYFLISRSDSTLRGHYPLEMDILSETNPIDGEILCPFFPEGGRYTVGDVHYVKEGNRLVPAAKTEFARDKTFGYRSSDLKQYVEEKTGGRVKAQDCISISLKELAALDVEAIKQKLMKAENRAVVVVNAVTYADLKVFCAALILAMKDGKRFLARTAAAFTKVMGRVSDAPLLTRTELRSDGSSNARGGLVLIGSHVKKTSDQLACLKQSGLPLSYMEFDVNAYFREGGLSEEKQKAIAFARDAIGQGRTAVIYTSRSLLAPENFTKEEKLAVSVQISEALTGIVAELGTAPAFLIAKGGITSSDVGTRGLRVRKATVAGQIKKGIPVWKTGPESRFPGLPYIIFPGNVGDVQTLKEIVEELL